MEGAQGYVNMCLPHIVCVLHSFSLPGSHGELFKVEVGIRGTHQGVAVGGSPLVVCGGKTFDTVSEGTEIG